MYLQYLMDFMVVHHIIEMFQCGLTDDYCLSYSYATSIAKGNYHRIQLIPL